MSLDIRNPSFERKISSGGQGEQQLDSKVSSDPRTLDASVESLTDGIYATVRHSPLFTIPRELRDHIYAYAAATDVFPENAAIEGVSLRDSLYDTSAQEGFAFVEHHNYNPVAFLTTCRAIKDEAGPVVLETVPLRLHIGLKGRRPAVPSSILRQIQRIDITIDVTEPALSSNRLQQDLQLLRDLDRAQTCHVRLDCHTQEIRSDCRIELLPAKVFGGLAALLQNFRTVIFSSKHYCSGYHVSPHPLPLHSSHIAHQVMMEAVKKEMTPLLGTGQQASTSVEGEITPRLTFRPNKTASSGVSEGKEAVFSSKDSRRRP